MKRVAIMCIDTETKIKSIRALININTIPIGTIFYIEEPEKIGWKNSIPVRFGELIND